MTNLSKIYEHLGDEVSKEVFGYRVLYTETKDSYWIRKLWSTFPEGVKFLNILECKKYKKVIFGAGDMGKVFAKISSTAWECFVDNYKCGTKYLGIPVISFDEYLKLYSDAYIVIASGLWHEDMVKQLQEAGIAKNKIIDLLKYYDLLGSKQYFELPEIYHDKDEIFVDCGCFDGSTSKNFVKWCNNQYSHIYAFEPERDKIEQCKAALECYKSDIYNLGVWSKKDELHFSGNLGASSCVSENGELVIEVDSLDNKLEGVRVTFIKMDIEGSEVEALRGAKKIIQQNSPKLAISIYHCPEDIYEIPQLLLEYNPNYTFYLRHYTFEYADTVLYAIDKKSGNL